MASSRVRKPTAKAQAAAATRRKPAARSRTHRDKQTASERAAQRGTENAEEVADEAIPEEDNAPESPEVDEGGEATHETPGTSEIPQSASNSEGSDVEELGSRPVERKSLGKAYLISQIKVSGVAAARAPPTNRRGFEFSDGDEGIDICILLTDLFKETKERVESELADMGDIVVELVRIFFEAGRKQNQRTFPVWSGEVRRDTRYPQGSLPVDEIVDMLSSEQSPYYLSFTHTWKINLPAVQTTPRNTATPRRAGIEIFMPPASMARSVPSPADGQSAVRRLQSVASSRGSPAPQGSRAGSVTDRMLAAMDGESDPIWETHKQLMRTWQCHEGTRCKANRRHRNKGDSLQQWCYVMKNGTHISLTDADLAAWAQAIVDGEAALRGPPEELLLKWKEALESDQTDEEPGDDGVSLVRKRKKPRKGNKQRESGINVVINPSINLHAPGFAYGQPAMGAPPAAPSPAYPSQGFDGLPALPAPSAVRPGSPVRQQTLVVMSSSPPQVPGDQKTLRKDFIFEALRKHCPSAVERRQLVDLQKAMSRERIDLRALHSKEDLWFDEKGLSAVKKVRKLVKPYLREREDLSVLLASDDGDDDLPAPPAPAQSEPYDPQLDIESQDFLTRSVRSPPVLDSSLRTSGSVFEEFSE